MVFEYATRGDLFHELQARREKVDWASEGYQWAFDVASAMSFIHQCSMIHRDIKTDNVLVSDDGCLKLCDFNLSIGLAEAASAVPTGTLFNMPPEIILGNSPSFAQDIYAFGVMLWEIDTRQEPWAALSDPHLLKKVSAGARLSIPVDTDEKVASLMQRCWLFNPKARPSSDAICDELREYVFKINQSLNKS